MKVYFIQYKQGRRACSASVKKDEEKFGIVKITSYLCNTKRKGSKMKTQNEVIREELERFIGRVPSESEVVIAEHFFNFRKKYEKEMNDNLPKYYGD